METFLIKALQLILSLSILVIIHELGHFMFARIFKIKVEKFYLFFNPWFTPFKFKPKNSDTEYGIGWLPLGGYVKIAGMMDESMDKEQLAQPPQPWEFRTKPAWQRLLVMVGGVLFNFILAMFIFSMMLFAWGDTYLPLKNAKQGMAFSESVKAGGFQDKDIMVSADGEEFQMRGGILDMNMLMKFIDADAVVVERDGKLVTIHPPVGFADNVIASRQQPYDFWKSPVIDSVLSNSEASRIGLKPGDSITSLDGTNITSFNKLQSMVGKMGSELKGDEKRPVSISFSRDGEIQTVTAMVDTAAIIGINARAFSPFTKENIQTDNYSFFTSFPAGIELGVGTLKAYVTQSRFIFTKEGAKSVSGFGGIGKMFPAEWDWQTFWTMTAFLSIVLAFMNILPIPMLDGGHIMFLLYEVITRRKPNEKFQEYAQTVGMVLLLGLLVVANGNDIVKAIFG
ncbi:RIP metalloprotease RseP [Dysgonomonas sp. ZJ709]|uniref:RIP metalloprotease RseP n=1 Tax=Dysgonomonas sp. ZJ709 TaxID=2709797 RepID=UPI0013ECC5A8|nr:RIP metalloprotease RseP [Dysgonomonas sp. ZJ709]